MAKNTAWNAHPGSLFAVTNLPIAELDRNILNKKLIRCVQISMRNLAAQLTWVEGVFVGALVLSGGS